MKKASLALLALLAGVVLGLWSLRLPAPAGVQAPGFSAERAQRDLAVIARNPHPVWDQASLAPVREHLRSRLAGLGLTVTTQRYGPLTDAFGHTYPLENLSASLPGRSGSFLLLVSHYDSAPKKRQAESAGSCGAADDGYGVATMLELAGLLAAEKAPRENGVRFLFTDAEETGLLGAQAELRQNLALYQDVNLVLNLEARGIKGPVVMFETGRNNLASLQLYRKASHPFAYSFAVDVYRRMPNGTDLTIFLRKGFPGLNFAVLDDLSYYHTPRDNPSNVCLGSLQHYGEQILPIVRAYARDGRFSGKSAFASREDMVYFTWLPGILFSWPRHWDLVLSLGLALVFLGWSGGLVARGRATLGASLRWLMLWLGFAAGSLGLGLLASFLMAKATGQVWKLTYLPNVPHERLITWFLLLGLCLVAYRLAARRLVRGRSDRSPLIAAMALNGLLLVVLTCLLPGGTFLASAPLLACLASVLAAERLHWPALALAGVVFTVSLFVPVLHLISLALTAGALGIVLVVAAFPLALVGAMAADRDC